MNRLLFVFKLHLITCLSLLFTSHFSVAKTTTHLSDQDNNLPLRIAVSANFSPVLTKILPKFYRESGIRTEIISGSSGTLYQQIMHGAPYDIFLSADDLHPQRLVLDNLVVDNSLHTYAYGQLAFWLINNNVKADQSLTSILNTLNQTKKTTRIAIANPKTAPYGQRAFEALKSLNLWKGFQNKLITGINVTQTFQQIRSQAVTGGFVALSQLKINNLQGILVPENLYSPISQQLVILKKSNKKNSAKQLSQFLLSSSTQQLISQYGYKKINTVVSNSIPSLGKVKPTPLNDVLADVPTRQSSQGNL